jgi:DNA-binding MarR family transcriptional regulator
MGRQRGDQISNSPDSKNRLRLWLRLLRSSRAIEVSVRERLRVTYGVTLPQFDVMAALNRYDSAVSMSEISRFLMVSNGNVTGIVDRLVADGMATRTQGTNDRRKSFVRFTDKGRTGFAAMARDHESWVDELLGGIDSGKVAKLVEDLQCVMPRAGGDSGK